MSVLKSGFGTVFENVLFFILAVYWLIMSSQSQGFPFQKFCLYDSTHRSELTTNSFFLAQIIVLNGESLSTECLDNCSHNDVIMSQLRKRDGTSTIRTVGVVVLLSAAGPRTAH